MVSQATEPPPVPLMENVTEPVGVPVAGLTRPTVAVKLTGCPVTLGKLAELTVVVVEPFLMGVVSEPLLVTKLLSPEYTALTV